MLVLRRWGRLTMLATLARRAVDDLCELPLCFGKSKFAFASSSPAGRTCAFRSGGALWALARLVTKVLGMTSPCVTTETRHHRA